jgi:hypothetical protein
MDERRDAGDAVIAAEKFQLAEQVKQAQAPGDGAERKIVTGKTHAVIRPSSTTASRAADGQRRSAALTTVT